MVSIYNIVDSLNEHLTPLFEACKITDSKIYGIAETVFRDNISQPEINEKSVGFDDTYSAMIYHKLSSLNSGIEVSQGGSYGRNIGYFVNTYGVGMVIFLDKKKTGLYPDQLLQYIQANFPTALKVHPYESANIRFASAILDSRLIFTQEYNANDTYKLKSDQYLFRINYSVELKFDKNCFSKCP